MFSCIVHVLFFNIYGIYSCIICVFLCVTIYGVLSCIGLFLCLHIYVGLSCIVRILYTSIYDEYSYFVHFLLSNIYVVFLCVTWGLFTIFSVVFSCITCVLVVKMRIINVFSLLKYMYSLHTLVNILLLVCFLSLFVFCVCLCIAFLRVLFIHIYMLFSNIMFHLSNPLYMPYTNVTGTSSVLFLMVILYISVFVVYNLYNTALYMFNFLHLCYLEKYRIYANIYISVCFCFVLNMQLSIAL